MARPQLPRHPRFGGGNVRALLNVFSPRAQLRGLILYIVEQLIRSRGFADYIVNLVRPVGSIYTNLTGVDPALELGFGTWTPFAVGRALVGFDVGDPDFNVVEQMVGTKTHAHEVAIRATAPITAGAIAIQGSAQVADAVLRTSPGAGPPLDSSVQPSIVVHFWKRTA